MSRVFDGTENQSLRLASAIRSGEGVYISLWYYWDGTVPLDHQYMFSIGDNGGSVFFGLRLSNGDPPVLECVKYDGTTTGVSSYGIDAASGVWQHALATFATTSNRTVYSNGTAATTDTTLVAGSMAGLDSTMIGALATDANGTKVFNGKIAEVHVWSANIAGLVSGIAAGVSPMLAVPNFMVSYVPCLMPQGWAAGGTDDEPDWIIAGDWIENGTVLSDSDHPAVYYPSGSPFPWGYTATPAPTVTNRFLPLLGVGV